MPTDVRPAGSAHGDLDPHGAVWCAEHASAGTSGRWECSKNSKRTKERCHDIAIRGRAACKTHVGEPTELARAKGEINMRVWAQQTAWSGRRPEGQTVDPSDAVLDELYKATARCDVYGELVRLQLALEAEGGLVGRTFAAGREGTSVATGEQLRGLVKLESEERDRKVRYAKTAHDMGIDQRVVEIEEAKATRVVSSFMAGLEELMGFIPESDRASARDAAVGRFLEGIGRSVTVAGEVVGP